MIETMAPCGILGNDPWTVEVVFAPDIEGFNTTTSAKPAPLWFSGAVSTNQSNTIAISDHPDHYGDLIVGHHSNDHWFDINLQSGQPVYLAVRHSGSADDVFLNGGLFRSASVGSLSFPESAGFIGKQKNYENWYAGTIDAIRVSGVARTDNEIAEVYSQLPQLPEPGNFTCSPEGMDVRLGWTNPVEYGHVEIWRNGEFLGEASGEAGAVNITDEDAGPGGLSYEITGVLGALRSPAVPCGLNITVPPPVITGSSSSNFTVTLNWENQEVYSELRLYRSGAFRKTISGSATSTTDTVPDPGVYSYELVGLIRGTPGEPAAREVEVDYLPPPGSFNCTPGELQVQLSWRNDHAYDAIQVYREDLGEVETIAGSSKSYLDPVPRPGTYRYTLVAWRGEYSAASEICVSEVTRIPRPRNLTCRFLDAVVKLTWENPIVYNEVLVLRDGGQIASLGGDVTAHSDLSPPKGNHSYGVVGVLEDVHSTDVKCTASVPSVFTFGFEGCPGGTIEGVPGEIREVELFATLSTANNTAAGGAQGWSLGIEVAGGVVQAVELGGVVASTIYDDDGSPGTPPLDPYLLDLKDAATRIAEPASHEDDPSRKGVISAVLLSGERYMVLQPEGTQRLAKITVEVELPEGEGELLLRYEEGLLSSESQPVPNVVTFESATRKPDLRECRVRLLGSKPRGGLQVPGDCTQDGTLDISDAICFLGVMFLGKPKYFPCGDGLPGHPGNLGLMDWQQDGMVDVSDAASLLRFLFLGGPAHRFAIPGQEIEGCVEIEGCQDNVKCL